MRMIALLALLGACTTGTDKEVDTDSEVDTVVVDTDLVDADGDGVTADVDCDDADEAVGAATEWFADVDTDGYGGASVGEACVQPAASTAVEGDCDDAVAAINPEADEVCDGVDNDCDELADDADDSVDLSTGGIWWPDLDLDTYGDMMSPIAACDAPADAVDNDADCNDAEPLAWMGALEVCDDGVDNNCNGDADDDDITLDTSTTITWYLDQDSDGDGLVFMTLEACAAPDGYAISGSDCNDSDPEVSSIAAEICDGKDNNCDQPDLLVDEADPAIDWTGVDPWFADADLDGFGAGDVGAFSCDPPADSITIGGDCNDASGDAFPGNPEFCDSLDNDCDGLFDEEDDSLDPASAVTFWVDADGDDRGEPATDTLWCADPGDGWAANAGDCNDGDALAWTGAAEVCDGSDNDCNGLVDEADPAVDLSTAGDWYVDGDGDGVGAGAATAACSPPTADHEMSGDDCNDGDATVSPDEDEICDGKDNNCDPGGLIDDADPAAVYTASDTLYYPDLDNDGFGDADGGEARCEQPADWFVEGLDCNDGDGGVNPDAVEVCNGQDDNCDLVTDPEGAWWDTSWPYRLTVTVESAGALSTAHPIAVDIDFDAELIALGDLSGLDPATIRVVNADCGVLGNPELPSQYMDGFSGIFDRVAPEDPPGDGHGGLVFLYDEDGDYSTAEAQPGSSTAAFDVYFASAATAGVIGPRTYTSSLSGSTDGTEGTIGNAVSVASFSGLEGGLMTDLTLVGDAGAPVFGDQALSASGNGVFASTGWIGARGADVGFTLLQVGPVMVAGEATGSFANASASLDYRYVFFMFEGRPEVYAKVWMGTTAESTIGPQGSGGWSNSIRAFQVDNLAALSVDGTVDRAPGFPDWVHGTYLGGTHGFGVAYRAAPAFVGPSVFTNNARFLGLSGQDLDAAASGAVSSMVVAADTTLVDYAIAMAFPHAGAFADVQTEFAALRTGSSGSAGAAEAQP